MTRHKTLEQLLLAGLADYAGRPSEAATKSYVAHLVRLLGSVRSSRLTGEDVRRYRAARRAEGSTAATRNREVSVLRAILRTALDRGDIEVLRVVKWGAEKEAVKTRWMEQDELKAVQAWIAERDAWAADVFAILRSSGARGGEILGAAAADWTDAGDRGVILVPDPKEGEAKTLVVTGVGLEAARRLADRGLARVFGRDGETARADHDRLAYLLEQYAVATGRPHVTPHDIRRSFAVRARRAGFSLEDIGSAMGHRNLATTARYARLVDQTKSEISAAVSAD